MKKLKVHNSYLISGKMPSFSSVMFLLLLAQIVSWSDPGGVAVAEDLEADDMYRDMVLQKGAPEVDPHQPEVELEAGDNFELTCKGNEPVKWHLRRTESEDIETDLYSVTSFEAKDEAKPYRSRVSITAATAKVVGRYYCVFQSMDNDDQDLDDLESEYKATSTYIFVKDPDNPLVPIEHPVVTATQYEEVVIPCKPSSKDVQVELFKDEQETPLDDYKFSEPHGFVLMAYRLDQSGVYLCRQKDNIDKTKHFHVEIMETCESLLASLNTTTNPKCKNTRARNAVPPLPWLPLSVASSDPLDSSSSNPFDEDEDDDFDDEPTSSGWTISSPLVSLLDYSSANTRHTRSSSSETTDEFRSTTQSLDDDLAEYVEYYDAMVATGDYRNGSYGSGWNNNNSRSNYVASLNSSGVGSNKLSAGRFVTTTTGSDDLSPSLANPSPSSLPPPQPSSSSSVLPLPLPTVTEYIQKPRVESEGGEHITLGHPIRLICTVDVQDGVKFDMRWMLPNMKRAENNSRVTVNRISVQNHSQRSNYVIGTLELLISHSTRADDGYYKCEVEDHNKHINHRNHRLIITTDSFINITEDNNLPFISASTTRPVRIIFSYVAHPQPEFYWVKDDDHNPLEAGEKYNISITSKSVTLTIFKPSVRDIGNYTLIASNGGAEANRSMKVFIQEKPILMMDPKYARPEEPVTFSCTAIGYPKPEMKFAFFPCTSIPWTNCSRSIAAKDIKETKQSARLVLRPEEEHIMLKMGLRLPDNGSSKEYLTTEQFTINAETAGYVMCLANNAKGRSTIMADMLISNLEEPVWIYRESPQLEVTNGDRVSIVCAALVYNHTDRITFFLNEMEVVQSEEKGIFLESWYEVYAYRKRLVIESASAEHHGEIRCETDVRDSDQVESKELRLTVETPEAPSILNGHEKEQRELGLGDTNLFQCSADGMPRPSIEWLKNGEPMELDDGIQMNNGSLFFQFLKEKDTGVYTCRVSNKVATVEKVWDLRVKTIAVQRSWIIVVLSILFVLIFAVILISLFYFKKKREVKALKDAGLSNFVEGDIEQINPELSLDEQADRLPYKTEYEFPKEKLKLGKQLGAGAFGVVLKATAQGIMVSEDETTVAVKMVKKQTDNEVMRALISELKIMVHLGQHLNVVNLLGAVTKNIAKRELMVIVEYCRFGNVQNFLLKHRPYFIDQVNTETGEIDPSIEKNMFRWSKAGYIYNSQGLKYVNLSFSTHNLNNGNSNNGHHHPGRIQPEHHHQQQQQQHLQRSMVENNNHPLYCNYINSNNSAAYTNPKNHMNSKGYVRHSGIQNMAMVDSCNTEATVMTSVEGDAVDTGNNTVNSNEPLWRSNYGMDYKGPARSVTSTDLVCWASQVACGMEYLATRKVLHGDLAARNILLCDDNVVKICDFGLARSMYKNDNYKKKGEAPLPFKWLALECISDNVFSTYSDVWAYGIVLWEFFSLAKVPYPGMEANQDLYNKLRDGYRMEKPQYSTQDIYDIMLNCWNVKPDSRPTFKDLKSRFNAMLPEELRNHYIDLNEPYLAVNAEKEKRGETDYLANWGPPEEPAPSAPTYVNGIILPLPPITDDSAYLQMTTNKSDDSEESHFDFAAFNNSQPSPTLKNNLDSSPQTGSKRHKKKNIPEEIPMLRSQGNFGGPGGFNSDSETEATSPVPMVRTTKIQQQPEPEYTNVQRMGEPGPNDAFSNPSYIKVNEKRSK
ncbi:vascular endothelial growth factor receptor kdr-like isoform X4 [Uranotaenia lowii]|uniref:vascular endothelial growth factor receptor kdr-like isoform X4 n=1 Tax=Uranotaenia lowii TaxID=190385 RepID=UPI00247A3F73|nr:vascular endothelial growth factor receptor kdr-like isoform X4 [Uranotaenia lowii]